MAFRSKILTPKRKPQLTAVLSTAIWAHQRAFQPGRRVLTTSGDNTPRIWSVLPGRCFSIGLLQ
jgi:hypothetical protein